MTRTRRFLIVLATLVLASGAFAGTAFADQVSYLSGKVRTGDVVTVPAIETVRTDLYVFASMVTIDGTVDGDLVTTGSQITVNGTVNGSIIAAGSTITLNGQTKGAVRAAAGQVTINGPIGRDAVVAAGQFSTNANGKVGQDVLFATGATTLAGSVAGSVLGSSGAYTRSGSLGGTEEVTISGSGGGAQRNPVARDPLVDAVRQLAAVLVVGLLFLWLRPRLLPAWDALLRARPAAAAGYGILALVGFVAALIIAFLAVIVLAIILGVLTLGALAAIDVIGGLLVIALGTLAFVVVCAIVVDAVVSYVVGRAILRTTQLGQWQAALELALGAVIVVALESLPFVGGIAKLVVLLAGLGVMTLYAWNARPGSRAPAPASAV